METEKLLIENDKKEKIGEEIINREKAMPEDETKVIDEEDQVGQKEVEKTINETEKGKQRELDLQAIKNDKEEEIKEGKEEEKKILEEDDATEEKILEQESKVEEEFEVGGRKILVQKFIDR